MSYTLSMSGVIVGRSELEDRDATRQVARGAFRPGLGYELTEPVFDLYTAAGTDADALERYRRARDALRLTLTDSAGTAVVLRDLRIVRRPGGGSDTHYELEIETDDAAFWTA